MKPLPRRRSHVIAAAAILIAGIGPLAMWRAGEPLHMELAGCAVLHADGSCELPDDGKLKVWVDERGSAGLFALRDGVPFAVHARPVEGGRLMQVQLPPKTKTVHIAARDGLALRHVTLHVTAPREPHDLGDARLAFKDNEAARALQILDRPETEPWDEQARIQALMLRVQLDDEQGRPNKALDEVPEVITRAHAAGLASVETFGILWQARLLRDFARNPAEAERVLERSGAAFARVPAYAGWYELQLAHFRRDQGDLIGALVHIGRGFPRAARFDDGPLDAELRILRARIFDQLGASDEAISIIDGIADETLANSPCREAELRKVRGELLLEALEAAMAIDGDRIRKSLDPRPHLRAALARRGTCTQLLEIAETKLRLARAALLLGDDGEAEALLGEVHVSDTDIALTIEKLDLEGRLHLARKHWSEARERYEQLLAFGAGPAGARASYDVFWRAFTGLGEARLADDPEEGLRLLEEAEQILDRQATVIAPGDVALRTWLPARYVRGTARYLHELATRGRLDLSLDVMRRARRRRQVLLADAVAAADQPVDVRERRNAEITGKIQKVREEEKRWLAQLNGPEEKREEALRNIKDLRNEEMLLALSPTPSVPGRAPPLRSPRPGELLMACHPAVTSWLCVAASATEPSMVVRVRQSGDRIAPADLERDLLGPLAPRLRATRRLTVLLSGTLQSLDIEALPFDGHPLGTQLPIEYPLDLPSEPASPSRAPKDMLAVVDQTARFLPWSAMAARTVVAAHSTAPWRPHFHLLPARFAPADLRLPEMLPPIDRGALRTALEQAYRFVFYGHGASFTNEGRVPSLQPWNEDDGFSTVDIMTLRRVPEQVLLFGCDTTTIPEGWNDFIAAMGPGYAFVRRGSHWVIGPSRKTSPEITAALLDALLGREKGASLDDPAAALQQARKRARELLESNHKLTVEADAQLASFRVLVR